MNEIATIRPAMRGQVTAIIPQSIEEVFRVSKGVVQSGLAPAALIGGKSEEAAAMAVAVAIMSGAELGLKPMVALRSFTVINGKPALYGDGLINVVRQSGKAAYLRTGCEERAGEMVGWCEAKRSDTGETSRVEFSQTDAKRAGLWQTSGSTPWARYPQRMLAWRAAGWCLRELFGDVLGGMRDEFEAQEMVEERRPVMAPPPPAPMITVSGPTDDVKPFDPSAFLASVIEQINEAATEELVQETWDGLDVEASLTDHEALLQQAFDAKKAVIDAINMGSAS